MVGNYTDYVNEKFFREKRKSFSDKHGFGLTKSERDKYTKEEEERAQLNREYAEDRDRRRREQQEAREEANRLTDEAVPNSVYVTYMRIFELIANTFSTSTRHCINMGNRRNRGYYVDTKQWQLIYNSHGACVFYFDSVRTDDVYTYKRRVAELYEFNDVDYVILKLNRDILDKKRGVRIRFENVVKAVEWLVKAYNEDVDNLTDNMRKFDEVDEPDELYGGRRKRGTK